MGGQACVFYGAAEFSRDADFVLLAHEENLIRLNSVLKDLQAVCIAIPPFNKQYLQRGHAIHFRCHHPQAKGIRIDIMSVLRGVDPFPKLWERRTTLEDSSGIKFELLSLPDLVKAKKTQRAKDWPMIQRLLEAHYLNHRESPNPEQISFWMMELRTADFLIEAAQKHPSIALRHQRIRPLIDLALNASRQDLEKEFLKEQEIERTRDKEHWEPIKRELEQIRHAALKK